jgi:hypothetical protein
LCDLGEANDDELAHIIPELISDCPVSRVMARYGAGGLTHKKKNFYFWDSQYAFAYVRGVFLSLVVKKLAAPKERRK